MQSGTPCIVATIDGCTFDASGTTWRVRTPSERLLFNFTLPEADESMRRWIRETTAARMRTEAPETVHAGLNGCRVLLRFAAALDGSGGIGRFTLAQFEAYRAGLPATQLCLAKDLLETLRKMDRLGDRLGLAGLDDEFREQLPLLSVRTLPRVSAVKTMCPKKGALSEAELGKALRALRAAYELGGISLQNFSLAIMTIGLVPRPAQSAQLKVGDLIVTTGPDGSKACVLIVPRVKHRRHGRTVRRVTERPLVPSIGAILERQCAAAVLWGAKRGIAASECPMFPVADTRHRGIAWPELPGTARHSGGSDISARLVATFANLRLVSSRIEGHQSVSATRLRRTLASIARGRGRSYGDVGQLLGHLNGATAHVYVEGTVGMIERVEAAVDVRPLAVMFMAGLAAPRTPARSTKVVR